MKQGAAISCVARRLVFISVALANGCARSPVKSPEKAVPATKAATAQIEDSLPANTLPRAAVPQTGVQATRGKRIWKPPPFSKSVLRVPLQVPNPPVNFLKLPSGWKAQVVAAGLRHPRWLTIAPNGDLFVVESHLDNQDKKQPQRVIVLRGLDHDGLAKTKHLWSKELYLPFGIAFHNGFLYVANTDSVVRWPYQDGAMQAPGKPEVVISHIPELGVNQHWTRNILFSENPPRLYITIGSQGNADIEAPLRGTIAAFALDASGKPVGKPKIIASGMRNPTGLAIQPVTGKLWAVVNERDYLGDRLVPDYFTEVAEGGFYGWPYYFIGPNHDPRLPERADLKRKVLTPDVLLDAHCAPLGLAFTPDGRTALIARHGSQNRSVKVGYDIARVRFNASGRPVGRVEPIITGWLRNPQNPAVYGRPAGLALAKDGSLLIADDWGGRIWRITPGPGGF